MAKKEKYLTEPLIIRQGARYECTADGLCCTDIHMLGPVEDHELVPLERLSGHAIVFDDDGEEQFLRTMADGRCLFMRSNGHCAIHAEQGFEAKPEGCRRFPFSLTATPDGGRVATDHRCPCRSLGERPLVDQEAARSSLVDDAGDIDAEREVAKIRVGKGEKMDFADWKKQEAPLLKALLETDEDLNKIIDAPSFPPLKKTDWKTLAYEYIEGRDGSAFGFALSWVGDAIRRHATGDEEARSPRRPWTEGFRKVAERSPERTPRELYGDWLADEIWGLKWAERFTIKTMRHDLATRLEIARILAGELEKTEQLRPDHAAAEGIMAMTLVGDSEYWTDIVQKMRPE